MVNGHDMISALNRGYLLDVLMLAATTDAFGCQRVNMNIVGRLVDRQEPRVLQDFCKEHIQGFLVGRADINEVKQQIKSWLVSMWER